MPAEQVKELWGLINSGELEPAVEQQARAKIADYERRMSGARAEPGWVGTPQLGLDDETRTGIEQTKVTEQKKKSWLTLEEGKAAASEPQRYTGGGLSDPTRLSGAEAIEDVDATLPARKPDTFRTFSPDELKLAETFAQQGNSPNHAIALKLLQEDPDHEMATARLMQATGLSSPDAKEVVAESIGMLPDARKQIAAIPNKSKTYDFTGELEYQSSKGVAPWEIAMPVMSFIHSEWQEPALEEFQRDMRDTLFSTRGVDVEKLDENSDEYKRYADMRWERALNQAKGEDRTIRRASFMNELRPDRHGAEVLGHVVGNLLRFDQGRTLGLVTELNAEIAGLVPGAPSTEANRAAMRGTRASKGTMLGEMAGAMSPGSVPQQLMARASARIPQAAGGLPAFGRSAGLGAGTAGVEQLGKDVIENVSDMASGNEPTTPWSDVPGRAGQTAIWGGLFGAGAEGLAAGGRKLKEKALSPMSESSADLARAESVGIERGIFGAKLTPSAKRYEQELTRTGESIEGSMSRRLAQPIARAAYNFSQRGADDALPVWNHRREMYYRSPEGAAAVPITEMVDTALAMVNRQSPGGQDLPGAISADTLRKQLPNMFDVKSFKQVTPEKALQLKGTTWRKLPLPPDENGLVTIARPRKVDARTLDDIIHGLDERAGFTAGGKEVRDEAWRAFDIAARKTRDRFGKNEWTADPSNNQQLRVTHGSGEAEGLSALNAKLGEVSKQVEGELEAAGLPRKLSLRSKVTTKAGPPKSVEHARKTEKDIFDLEKEATGVPHSIDDPTYADRRADWLASERRYEEEYLPTVVEKLRPSEWMAIRMFTLGHDQPVRMLRRGVPEEEILRQYYDPAKAEGRSPQEFMRRVKLASEHIDSALRRAPKATMAKNVWRGVGFTNDQINGILQDGHFNLGGMPTSAARFPQHAQGFALRNASDLARKDVPVLLKMEHKSGVGIEGVSEFGKSEREVLLPGDASFSVKDAYWVKTALGQDLLVIEGKELAESTVGKVPPPKTAGGLDVDLSEATLRKFEASLQNVKRASGPERNYAAVLKFARLAGPEVEQELLTRAGMLAAKRLLSREGSAGFGVTPSGIYPRGNVGGIEGARVRLSRAANTAKAKPLAQAPPSEQLRQVLNLVGKISPKLGGAAQDPPWAPYPQGPREFSPFGMSSGGGMPMGVGHDEQLGVSLSPEEKSRVSGAPVQGAPEVLSAQEQTTLDALVSKLADFLVEQGKKLRGDKPQETTTEATP